MQIQRTDGALAEMLRRGSRPKREESRILRVQQKRTNQILVLERASRAVEHRTSGCSESALEDADEVRWESRVRRIEAETDTEHRTAAVRFVGEIAAADHPQAMAPAIRTGSADYPETLVAAVEHTAEVDSDLGSAADRTGSAGRPVAEAEVAHMVSFLPSLDLYPLADLDAEPGPACPAAPQIP